MPTREFADLVSVITATIEHVLPTDPVASSDPDQMTDALQWPADAYVLDGEKIIWHFPDAAARLIEDPR